MRFQKQNTKNIEEKIIVIGAAIILIIAIATMYKTTQDQFNHITADALARANISSSLNASCNLTLKANYNLVSFFCIMLDDNRSQILQNVTHLQAIFEYQEGAADPWKSYNPDLPSWVVHDLNTMSRKEGYWMNMKEDENVLISGSLRVPNSINLVQGWNLAGYPTNKTKNITTSLISLYGNYSEVRGFNAQSQSFLSHTPPASGGLTETANGQAYWINANASGVWVVD